MAYNRVQQRFDKSIRDALKIAKEARERESRESAERRHKKSAERTAVPTECASPKGPRMMLVRLANETTALVPWNHPEAVAWRAKRKGEKP